MGRGGSRVDGARVWAAVKRFLQALGAAGVLALVRLIVRHRRTAHAFLANNPHVHPSKFRYKLLGELPTILKNYHRLYDLKRERAQSHGRNNAVLTAFWDGRMIVSSSDPRVVKHILVDNVNNYIKSAVLIRVLKPLLGRGIFIANHGPHADDKGATWTYQRKTASKIFTRNVFQHIMADTFEANARKVCRLLVEVGGARPVDMQTIFFKYTMDSIGLIGFGVDLKTLDVEQPLGFTDAFDRAQKISAKRFLLPLAMTPLGPWLYESERELAACIRTMDHFCYKVIGERLRDAEVGKKRDILSNFINSMREAGDLPAQPEPDGSKVPDSVVFLRDVVMSFFIAGRDTTACTLSFTFLLLATHPEVQAKLFEELAQHMPDDAPPPTVTDFKQGFPYLHAVVQECLRLFPPVPTDGKEAVQRDVLPDGTVIEAGTAVNYETYVMGRSEVIWGPDAHLFRPERWIGPGKCDPTMYDMPTFQGGAPESPRVCLGQGLAVFEVKSLTAELVRRFSFTLARDEVQPPYVPGITLTVNAGLPLIAKHRPAGLRHAVSAPA